ncbi:hypothetical protein NM688_g5633 [Phlebia brevispora]|uniref:Uncharacterized protein n=1 Tax=Phlebia brevispora TaxID=194682 RepID=A0ACC1SSA5_9APHY|nr:hypothetical protein NM688_g5633 [Phlebia brevispora]
MEVDVPTPGTTQRSPINAAVAASSIMAGSSVIRPPSPTPSASSAEGSTRKRTPADSRSPTPEVPSDREKRAPTRNRTRARNGRSTRNRNRRKTKAEPVTEAVAEDHVQMDEHDLDGDDVDADSAELELESDLQPAHRAEALDVLATIELKYALLRERLYVEKMENLAWEEALVRADIHPEMLHLHAELSKRRDKRLELAARRRDYEIVNLTKRRRLDEDAVWSWWKYRREELQTTMIAENNRKRRRLERERRAVDRPLPERHIPSPPNEVPVAPTLRELVKNDPFESAEARRRQMPMSSLAYPRLTTLSQQDIISDLEYLNAHRRPYDSLRPGMMGVNPVMGHPAGGPGYDQFNMGVGMMDGPGLPNRLPQQVPFQQPPFQHAPPPNQMMPGFPGPGIGAVPRLQHHHSAPPGTVPNMVHSQMLMEQDVGPIRRPGSGAPHVSQFPGGPSVPLMRRSISPVPIQPHGAMPTIGPSVMPNKSNGWMGMAGPGSANLGGPSKEPVRFPADMRPLEMEALEREKERERIADTLKIRERSEFEWEREREREREREIERDQDRDRDRDREQDRDLEGPNQTPQMLQRQQHNHLLISPSQVANHLAHHHHRHHHHVHHHHHPQLSPSALSSTAATVVPSQASNGMPLDRTSPLLSREMEPRRVPGDMPMEGIEPSPQVKSALPAPMSSLWKGSEEMMTPSTDFAHDRGRAGLIPPAQERIPFVITPSQAAVAMHSNNSPSLRNAPGPSTAPASISSSRRGSWSAPDDTGMPRPSSSSSIHMGNTISSHFHPSAGVPGKRLQSSPSMLPQGSPLVASPSHGNGIRLPPLSPSTTPGVRSPSRMPQSLPPLSNAAAAPKPLSPKVIRRTSPPPNRTKSPGREQIGTLGSGPVAGPPTGKARPLSPVPIYPVSPSIPAPLSATPRMPSVSSGSDPNLPPVPQSVPS